MIILIKSIVLSPTPKLVFKCFGAYSKAVDLDGDLLMNGASTGDPCISPGVPINMAELQLGVQPAPGGVTDVNVIIIPQCVYCGAYVSLVRTWEAKPAGEHDNLWAGRRATNGLAKWLKDNGCAHPACVEELEAEPSDPPETADLPVDLSYLDDWDLEAYLLGLSE